MNIHAEEKRKFGFDEAIKNNQNAESYYDVTGILDEDLKAIEIKDDQGKIPFHHFNGPDSANLFKRIIRTLPKGYDLKNLLNTPNKKGETPLDVARDPELRQKFLEA